MSESITLQFIGLDVHRDSVTIAVARPDGQPAQSLATVPNDIPGLIKRLQQLGPVESLRCCYFYCLATFYTFRETLYLMPPG